MPEVLCCSLPCATNDFTNAAHSLQRLEVTAGADGLAAGNTPWSHSHFLAPDLFSHVTFWSENQSENHAMHHTMCLASNLHGSHGLDPRNHEMSKSGLWQQLSDTRQLWRGKRESFEFSMFFAICCVCSVCCICLFSRKASRQVTNSRT